MNNENMDGKREESPSKLTVLISLALLSLVHFVGSSPINDLEQTSCQGNEYLGKMGHCCDKCHPGYKLEEECKGSNQRTTCTPCPAGQYIERSNSFRNCFSCRKCKKEHNEKEQSACAPSRDRQCVCFDGFYRRKIDSSTSECLQCTICGPGERESSPCQEHKNRVCECKDNYYLTKEKTCVRCNMCNDDERCHELCSLPTTDAPERSSKGPLSPDIKPYVVMTAATLCIALVAAVVIITRSCCKMSEKRSLGMTVSQLTETPVVSPSASPESTRLISVPLAMTSQPAPAASSGELPDCVPREFDVSQFIYFLLDTIPVNRFKELVRRLGVPERDVERAERDNHTFMEAQYHMLRVWCDSVGGGSSGTLSYARLLTVVDTLRTVGLTSCAEALEAQYELDKDSCAHMLSSGH